MLIGEMILQICDSWQTKRKQNQLTFGQRYQIFRRLDKSQIGVSITFINSTLLFWRTAYWHYLQLKKFACLVSAIWLKSAFRWRYFTFLKVVFFSLIYTWTWLLIDFDLIGYKMFLNENLLLSISFQTFYTTYMLSILLMFYRRNSVRKYCFSTCKLVKSSF